MLHGMAKQNPIKKRETPFFHFLKISGIIFQGIHQLFSGEEDAALYRTDL